MITFPGLLAVIRRRLAPWQPQDVYYPGPPPDLPGGDREVLERFRGVDNFPWPIHEVWPPGELTDSGLLAIECVEAVRSYPIRYAEKERMDVILVEPESMLGWAGRGEYGSLFSPCGWDYGYCVPSGGLGDVCSAIYQDVLYGYDSELRSMLSALNQSLLFDTREGLEELIHMRLRYIERGGICETEGDFEPLMIYGLAGFPCGPIA